MYLEYFGLRALPFELTPNPKFLFMTTQHREAWSNLQYGLSSRKAVTLLIGEVGTGKTTLLRTVLESETCRTVRCLYVSNPTLTRAEFVETLARGFDLTAQASTSKAMLLAELQAKLEQRRAAGECLALVVDEAQAMSDELLEEIRLLSNLETNEEKLLPLVLTGQPELADRLRQPQLRQLRQRVSLQCEIGPFELNDSAAYIAHRIRVVGGVAGNLFTRDAVTLIHQRARGIPRTLNVLCDNALVGTFGRGAPRVTAEVVLEVCRDFGLAESRSASVGTAVEPVDRSDDDHGASLAPPATLAFTRQSGSASTTEKAQPPAADAGQDGVPPEGGTEREMFQPPQRRRFSLFG